MTGLSKFLGRGLLVLAISSFSVACGDDDDGTSNPDGGEAGKGGAGSGGKGGAGSGGKGGAGSGGKGGAGAGAGGAGGDSCEDIAEKNSAGVPTNNNCRECVCEKSQTAAKACTKDCWTLAYCVVDNGCDATDTTCIANACTDDLGTVAKLVAAGDLATAVDFDGCAADCFAPEIDAGN
jgi:hypothetical protein